VEVVHQMGDVYDLDEPRPEQASGLREDEREVEPYELDDSVEQDVQSEVEVERLEDLAVRASGQQAWVDHVMGRLHEQEPWKRHGWRISELHVQQAKGLYVHHVQHLHVQHRIARCILNTPSPGKCPAQLERHRNSLPGDSPRTGIGQMAHSPEDIRRRVNHNLQLRLAH
jgi:hypothetical protein